MTCNLCGSKNPPDAVDCVRCGKKIKASKRDLRPTTVLVVEG